MSFSIYLEDNVNDAIGNNDSFVVAQAYIKLHTGDPGTAGTGSPATETTRKAVSFAASSGGVMTSDAAVSWTGVAGTETYSHISLWDASTGGNCLGSGALTTARAVTAGNGFTIPSGALSVSRLFSPTSVPDLKLWLDFADAAKLFTDAGTTPVAADADLIYQVNDKSGNGYHATQATSGNRPLYKVNIANGRAVARFDGTTDFLEKTSGFYNFATNDRITVFVVADADAAAQGFMFEITAGFAYDRGPYIYSQSGVGTAWVVVDSVGNKVYVDALTPPWTGLRIFALQWNGAATTQPAYVNGVAFSGTPGAPGLNAYTINRYIVGARVDGSVPFQGDVAEIIAYDAVLSNATLNLIGNYLAAKYGLTWTTI